MRKQYSGENVNVILPAGIAVKKYIKESNRLNSNINEVTRADLDFHFFFFLQKDFARTKSTKSTKAQQAQEAQEAQKCKYANK